MKIFKSIWKTILGGGKILLHVFSNIPETCVVAKMRKTLKKDDQPPGFKIFFVIVFPIIALLALYLTMTFFSIIIVSTLSIGNNTFFEKNSFWSLMINGGVILSVFYIVLFEIVLPLFILFKRWTLKKLFNRDTYPNSSPDVTVISTEEELDDDELEELRENKKCFIKKRK